MKSITFFILLLFSIGAFSQNTNDKQLEGYWLGKIANLRLILKFKTEKDKLLVLMDCPEQNTFNLKLNGAKMKEDSVFVDASNLPGKAYYDGKMQPCDTIIEGFWKQAGQIVPLQMVKQKSEIKLNRPQEPKPPFPYKSEDIVFMNTKDNIELAGTLTLPEGKGPFPVAIMITGSGPQNRNEEFVGHKPFWVIADYLTRKGIAVLRYDDRGFAQSKGTFANSTIFDFAKDAHAALDFLSTRKEINKNQMGIIGHSEGGIVASIVASERKELGFIVLLAGPGVSGFDILEKQTIDNMTVQGAKKEDIDKVINDRRQLFDILINEPDFNIASQKILKLYVAQNKLDTITNKQDIENYAAFKNTMQDISFRTFITSNSQTYLEKIKCPVLALNGSADLMVNADINLTAIENALKKGGNKKYKIKKFDKLDHAFQHYENCDPAKYSEVAETFSVDALKTISDWIRTVMN
jgi:uncharacterized protein